MLPQLVQLLQIMTTITKHKTPMTVATNRTPQTNSRLPHHNEGEGLYEPYLFGDDEGLGLEVRL